MSLCVMYMYLYYDKLLFNKLNIDLILCLLWFSKKAYNYENITIVKSIGRKYDK